MYKRQVVSKSGKAFTISSVGFTLFAPKASKPVSRQVMAFVGTEVTCKVVEGGCTVGSRSGLYSVECLFCCNAGVAKW